MKKHIRVLAVVALTAITVACFAGCKPYIEHDNHPNDFIVLSRDKETLEYQGSTYYKIPKDAELFCAQKTSNKIDEYLNVYKDGTPDVISNIFNATGYYNSVQDYFCVEFWSIEKLIFDSKTYNPPTELYCNKSDYDIYQKFLNSDTPMERIGFEYITSLADPYNYNFDLGIISENASKEIINYLENPSALTKESYGEFKRRMVTSVLYAMYQCDSRGELAKRLEGYDIFKTSNREAWLVNTENLTAVKLTPITSETINYNYMNSTFSIKNP